MASSSKQSAGKYSKLPLDEEVPVFWDLNTCPIQSRCCPENLVTNIEKVLRQVHLRNPCKYPKYNLSKTRVACGDLTKVNETTQTCLRAQGFTLLHAHERHAYCVDHKKMKPNTPAPEFWLGTHLIEYAIKHRNDPHKNILFISGDYDFSDSLDILWTGNYTVFLAMRYDSERLFEIHGNYTFYWENMQFGNGGFIRYDPPF